jgi:hypothetical protein
MWKDNNIGQLLFRIMPRDVSGKFTKEGTSRNKGAEIELQNADPCQSKI